MTNNPISYELWFRFVWLCVMYPPPENKSKLLCSMSRRRNTTIVWPCLDVPNCVEISYVLPLPQMIVILSCRSAEWAVSIHGPSFPGIGIPTLKIRRSRDRLIFNMGIPLLVRRHIDITAMFRGTFQNDWLYCEHWSTRYRASSACGFVMSKGSHMLMIIFIFWCIFREKHRPADGFSGVVLASRYIIWDQCGGLCHYEDAVFSAKVVIVM